MTAASDRPLSDQPDPGHGHPDRSNLPVWSKVGLTLSTGLAVGATGRAVMASQGGDQMLGVGTGLLVTVMVLWGLPSVSIRFVSRFVLLATLPVLARFATLSTGTDDGLTTVLAWVVGAVTTLVLADRVTMLAHTPLEAVEGPADVRRRVGRTVSAIAVLSVLAVVATLFAAPFASDRFATRMETGSGSWNRRGSGPGVGASLRSSDHMDMSTNPELTDEILLTVRSDRRSFLRGDVYDLWDGERWTRSEQFRFPVGLDGEVRPADNDLGVFGSDVFEQRIRVEAPAAAIYVGSPSVVRIEATGQPAQAIDGTLAPWGQPVGRGTVYTVTSRAHDVTPERLRALGTDIPVEILDRYAAPPVATDRVVALAREVVEEAGASNHYDMIRALEAWMGANLEYSIDAPPSRPGVDAVDEFLFDTKLGWCQQIASSLVVMARSLGIPARMATGFVAVERDRSTGDIVVRARHSHAWAEVWFPEVGWVSFDPTVDVPLAPTPEERDTWADRLRDGIVPAIVVAGIVAVVAFGGSRIVRVWRRCDRRRPRHEVARLDRKLVALGARWGLDRGPNETASAFAGRVAEAAEDPALVPVGQLLDDHLYAPAGGGAADLDDARGSLDVALQAAPRGGRRKISGP